MGGFFGGGGGGSPAPQATPAPVVQPRAAIRPSDDDPAYRKKRRVSGEKATILTGTQGLTATGESNSVKTLLGG